MKNPLSNIVTNVVRAVERFSTEPNAEGLLWKDYHPLPLATSVLPAALVYAGIEAIKKTITVVDSTDDLNSRIPSNAIVYLLHADIWVSALCTDEIAKVVSGDSAYLGYHGFMSYLSSGWSYALGVNCIRYDRKRSLSAREQVLEFVQKTEGRFFLRTDAGGPYGRVRASLIDLALASNKPLVPVRQFATKKTIWKSHQIPLMGSKVHICAGEVLWPEELAKMTREEACARLQKDVDDLCCPV